MLENIRTSLLHHLQKTPEEAVVLLIGGKDFPTSMVTLRADPTSLMELLVAARFYMCERLPEISPGKAQEGDWEWGSILGGPSFSVADLSDCVLKPM